MNLSELRFETGRVDCAALCSCVSATLATYQGNLLEIRQFIGEFAVFAEVK
jgi:hypothetical protein